MEQKVYDMGAIQLVLVMICWIFCNIPDRMYSRQQMKNNIIIKSYNKIVFTDAVRIKYNVGYNIEKDR